MIVCFGDSITYGQHLEPEEKPWPRLIKGDVLSFGVPGDTTRLGLERFPREVQELEPEVVVIQFGHNDCNRWDTDRGLPRVSIGAFRENLVEMIVRSQTFNARPFLCSLTPSLRSVQHGNDVQRYNEEIEVVAATKGVTLIDVTMPFLDHDDGNHLSELLMMDGLHLTAKGHELYAKVVDGVLFEAGLL